LVNKDQNKKKIGIKPSAKQLLKAFVFCKGFLL